MSYVIVVVGGLVLAAAVVYWVALYVCGRAQGIPRATIGRSLLIALLTIAAAMPLGIAAVMLLVGEAPLVTGLVLPTLLLGWLAVLIKWQFGVHWKPAATIAVIATVANGAVVGLTAVGLKSYALEAFTSPTNAMTPAIRGVHIEVACGNCGLDYVASGSDFIDHLGRPAEAHRFDGAAAVCPNCNQSHPFSSKTPPALRNGDRYLVDKLATPERWDIVCFYTPEDRVTLFSKRLVGLPNERVDLAGGDVFINGERVRKPQHRQEEFWTFVHDSHFHPKTMHDATKRWTSEDESWRLSDEGFAATPGEEPAVLTFRGPVDDQSPHSSVSRFRPPAAGEPVNDIRLQIDGLDLNGAAQLDIAWHVGEYQIVAELTRTHARLTCKSPPRDDVSPESHSLEGNAPRDITLVVRDGVAQLDGDGQTLATLEVFPKQLGQAVLIDADQPRRLELTAAKGTVSLSRLRLDRDVHYSELGKHAKNFQMGADEHFFLGDNSAGSDDSRRWGAVKRELLHSVVRWIYAPAGRFRILR